MNYLGTLICQDVFEFLGHIHSAVEVSFNHLLLRHVVLEARACVVDESIERFATKTFLDMLDRRCN